MALQVAEDNRLQRLASKAGINLRVQGCRYFGGTGITVLLQLDGEHSALQRATRNLQSMAEAQETYWVDVRNTRFMYMAISNELSLCSTSRASRILCVCCPYNHVERVLKWEVLVRTSTELNKLLLSLRRQGRDATVISESPVNQNELLTARQKQVLMIATKNGFFDFPRRMGLTELSDELHIDPSTLSETIRKAEGKIIRNSNLLPGIA